MHLVMISLDGGMLLPWSAVAKRTLAYADLVESITVIVYTPPGKETISLSDTVQVLPTNSRTKAHFLRDAWQLWKKICSILPPAQTVITTQDPFETALVGLFLKKKFGCGLHIQDHGNFFESAYWKKETILNQLRRYLWKWLLKQANAIRVVSQLEKDYLEQHGCHAITHVPVYVDTHPKVTKKQFHAGCTLLMLSRFVPQKNILFALKVLTPLFAKYDDMHLVLVGRWPLEKQIESYIAVQHVQNRITIKPWTDEVWKEYALADLFLLPSLYEGRWMTVIEAASYGVPVIMSHTWCAGDFLVDGYNGTVVPINDAHALTYAITNLYKDRALRITYSENGLHQLSKLLSREETLMRYAASWQAALPPSA